MPGDLPLGYHTLRARSDDREAACTLIVTPGWLGFPGRMGESRTWGLATQIYSVRSAQSWGVGDLVDLADLGVWAAAEQGAGFVLVNPLHAAEPIAPMEPSPYLPTSRRFTNPLYLRPERIPEFADLDDRGRAEVAAAHQKLDRRTARGRTPSTGTGPGRPSGRRSGWSTRFRAPPAGSWRSGPSADGKGAA